MSEESYILVTNFCHNSDCLMIPVYYFENDFRFHHGKCYPKENIDTIYDDFRQYIVGDHDDDCEFNLGKFITTKTRILAIYQWDCGLSYDY